jgi:preprotein translocase subunit SecE
MKFINLIIAEARMLYWSLRRYMFNTVAMLVVMFLIFMGMFWGVKSIGGTGVTGDSFAEMYTLFCTGSRKVIPSLLITRPRSQ